MRRDLLIVLCALAGCGGDPRAIDAAVSDAEIDAARVSDVGIDMGFDAATLGNCDLAAPPAFAIPAHVALTNGDALIDHDFSVLTALERLPGVETALQADTALAALATGHDTALRDADVATCDPACVRAALVRTPDAAAIDATITALTTAALLDDVASELRSSLAFERYAERDDDVIVRTALTEAIANLVSAFDAYGIAELAPTLLADTVHSVVMGAPRTQWWQPLARVTSAAMIADGRDEAIRHEPLTTENAAAIAAIATTNFSAFPYVAILVPGQGPADATTALNPAGAARCDLAVARYHAGLAPFLLLSGGYAHPDRTVFSEAIEMKHYIMATYDVPESAILVDPYARHTTTNVRDAVRELFLYGAPTDGHLLIVTDLFQSAYIASEAFAMRCDDELSYRPFLGLQVLTPTDTCVTMAPASLTIAASDPLDP